MTQERDQKPKHGGARPNSGGARPGAGRKRDPDAKGVVSMRLTGEQRLKFLALGGNEWFRRLLDGTPWPDERGSK